MNPSPAQPPTLHTAETTCCEHHPAGPPVCEAVGGGMGGSQEALRVLASAPPLAELHAWSMWGQVGRDVCLAEKCNMFDLSHGLTCEVLIVSVSRSVALSACLSVKGVEVSLCESMRLQYHG